MLNSVLKRNHGKPIKVFIHGGHMTPWTLVEEIVKIADRGYYFILYGIHSEGEHPGLNHENIELRNLFSGVNVRDGHNSDYIPMGLGVQPEFIKRLGLHVALIGVAEDHNGDFSFSLGHDVAVAATQAPGVHICAQVFDNAPVTYGERIKKQTIHEIFRGGKIEPHPPGKAQPAQTRIGEIVADLIPPEPTVQIGIGAISNMVASCLVGIDNVTIWSEMITDQVIDLVDHGHVPSTVTTSFAIGSEKLWNAVDYPDDYSKPKYYFRPINVTNNIRRISTIPNFCSINNVVAADLFGATICDRMGGKHHSGIGGQADFNIGCNLNPRGNSFLCLKSQTSRGESRIQPEITGATVPKHFADWIVTEQGAVRLKGLTLSQRVKAMITIAHPDHRDFLEFEGRKLL